MNGANEIRTLIRTLSRIVRLNPCIRKTNKQTTNAKNECVIQISNSHTYYTNIKMNKPANQPQQMNEYNIRI